MLLPSQFSHICLYLSRREKRWSQGAHAIRAAPRSAAHPSSSLRRRTCSAGRQPRAINTSPLSTHLIQSPLSVRSRTPPRSLYPIFARRNGFAVSKYPQALRSARARARREKSTAGPPIATTIRLTCILQNLARPGGECDQERRDKGRSHSGSAFDYTSAAVSP